MRPVLFLVLLVFWPHLVNAQETVKYWIFLTDKYDVSGKHTQVEDDYLSGHAVARRIQRGEPGLASVVALQDAPISPVYEEDLFRRGFKIEQRSRWLNAVTAWLSEDDVRQIAPLPYVREIRPVAHIFPDIQPLIPVSPVIPERVSSNCPSSRFGPSCTQLDVVNAIPPIERDINGRGVILGFIDNKFSANSAAPFSHRSLRHILDDGRLGEFRDFTNMDSSQICSYSSSHGMAVASIAVGYHEGILIGPGYGATIYAAATECSSYERNIEEDNFVAAVEWMEARGVDVITASLGYLGFDDGQRSYTRHDLDGNTGLTTIAMDAAASRGVIPINSAGNSGFRGPQTITMPADGHSVIAVGGIWPDGQIFDRSSRGPTADGRIKPDVTAQGVAVDFASGMDGYERMSGTSLAAPMVAGIVAQILQVNRHLKPRDVWNLLTSTASRSNAPNNDYGWGIVNADAAIMSAVALRRSEEAFPVPDNLTLHAPYPNPFRDIVYFTVEATEPVSYAQLTIFDVLGREAAIVHQGTLQTGGLPIQFDGSDLPPGIYTYALEHGGRTQSGMLIRLDY